MLFTFALFDKDSGMLPKTTGNCSDCIGNPCDAAECGSGAAVLPIIPRIGAGLGNGFSVSMLCDHICKETGSIVKNVGYGSFKARTT